MRNWINIFTIFAFAFFVSCSRPNKNDNASQQQIFNDSFDSFIDTVPDISGVDDCKIHVSIDSIINDFIECRIIEDTVIGHWSIRVSISSNDIIIKRHDYKYIDYSVFLTILYDGNVVYNNKEIRTKDVTGSDGEFMMLGGHIFWVSDSALYLSFACVLPDTDDGWYKLYQIQPDGTSNFFCINEEMGVEGSYIIAYFLPLYFNEKAINSSVTDLKRLYDEYCTKELAEELLAGTIQIAYDDTDFRYADSTSLIESIGSLAGSSSGINSFKVEFKPNQKEDTVPQILYMEVEEASNKISRIDKVHL